MNQPFCWECGAELPNPPPTKLRHSPLPIPYKVAACKKHGGTMPDETEEGHAPDHGDEEERVPEDLMSIALAIDDTDMTPEQFKEVFGNVNDD